uniref:DUF2177 family protein n=1 Tax=viral metagenome TaxID=1070528 RepID=A0A6C0BC17_9ZZZZ
MHVFLKIFFISLIFVVIDSLYLFSSKTYFQKQILSVQKGPIQLRIVPTVLCYIALIFGLWYFILREKKSWIQAFLLGIVIYSVYETTNYATLKAWTAKTVIMDTVWGGILFALVTKIVQLLNI